MNGVFSIIFSCVLQIMQSSEEENYCNILISRVILVMVIFFSQDTYHNVKEMWVKNRMMSCVMAFYLLRD